MDDRMALDSVAHRMCRRATAAGQRLEVAFAHRLSKATPKIFVSPSEKEDLASRILTWNFRRGDVAFSFPLSKFWHPLARAAAEPRLSLRIAVQPERFRVSLMEKTQGMLATAYDFLEEDWLFDDFAMAVEVALQSKRIVDVLDGIRRRWLVLELAAQERVECISAVASSLGAPISDWSDADDLNNWFMNSATWSATPTGQWWRHLGWMAAEPRTDAALQTGIALARDLPPLPFYIALELAVMASRLYRVGEEDEAPTPRPGSPYPSGHVRDAALFGNRLKGVLSSLELSKPKGLFSLVRGLIAASDNAQVTATAARTADLLLAPDVATQDVEYGSLADRLTELQVEYGFTRAEREALLEVMLEGERDRTPGQNARVVRTIFDLGASVDEAVLLFRLRDWLRSEAPAEMWMPSYATLLNFLRQQYEDTTPDAEEAVYRLRDVLFDADVDANLWGWWLTKRYRDEGDDPGAER